MTPLASHLLLWGSVLLLVATLVPLLTRLEGRCVRGCTRQCCMPEGLHAYLNDGTGAQVGARPGPSSRPDDRIKL